MIVLKYRKYPRIRHLPFSQSNTSDDVWLNSTSHLYGKMVVITEKLDGENCTFYNDNCHARSIDSMYSHHPSRSYVKALHSSLKHKIDDDMRVCGENVYAKHSIYYNDLISYFLVFGIFKEDIYLDWSSVAYWAKELGLSTVPVLYKGIYNFELESKLQSFWPFTSLCGAPEAEGFVVRLEDAFHINDFDVSVAKWVRPNHVQTNQHWMSQAIVPNKLR